MTTLILFLLLTPPLAWALHRDMRRADARRRRRILWGDLHERVETMKRHIGEALMPAMLDVAIAARQAAVAFAAFGYAAQTAQNGPESAPGAPSSTSRDSQGGDDETRRA